jgi:hypothetical protein
VSPKHVERKLAVILAADVAGYRRLIGTDEEGTLKRLKAYRRAIAQRTQAGAVALGVHDQLEKRSIAAIRRHGGSRGMREP